MRRNEIGRIKSLPRGKRHWNWTDSPSALTLHKRLHRRYGKAKWHNCVDCGKQADDWSNDTGKYTDKIEDYSPRCRSCHVKKDFTMKRRNRAKELSKDRRRDIKGCFLN